MTYTKNNNNGACSDIPLSPNGILWNRSLGPSSPTCSCRIARCSFPICSSSQKPAPTASRLTSSGLREYSSSTLSIPCSLKRRSVLGDRLFDEPHVSIERSGRKTHLVPKIGGCESRLLYLEFDVLPIFKSLLLRFYAPRGVKWNKLNLCLSGVTKTKNRKTFLDMNSVITRNEICISLTTK